MNGFKPVLVLAALSALNVSAQISDLTELDFESLSVVQVSSASKYIQPLREAPASVEVITRAEIQRFGWRTLSEALSSLPGIYVSTDRAYDFLGVRGFAVPGDYNTRLLLLIDGNRVSDAAYGQAPIGADFGIDMALVERIEYVPGPGSAIYGGNAIFGVINVITRKPSEVPNALFAATMDSEGWREARVAGARRFESGSSLMLSYSSSYRSGSDLRYDDPLGQLASGGTAHDLDQERIRRLFGRYEDGNLTLTGRYSNRIVFPSSALYGTLFDQSGLAVRDISYALNARYQGRLSDEARFETRLDYSQIVYRGDYPYEDSGLRYVNHDETRADTWLADVRLFYTGLSGHKLLTGVEAQWLDARQRNYDLDAAVNEPIDIVSRSRRLGLYVQDEWAFAERWRLSTGLRHDRASDASSMNSPRLGLIWLPTRNTTFKLLGGRAYRLPSPYERDYGNGINYLPNPGLRPEQIQTLELAWEQQLSSGQTFRASAFDYRLKSLVGMQSILVPGGLLSYQYQNGASVSARGITTAWKKTWGSGASLGASIVYTRAVDDHGELLSNSPRWQAKLHAMAPLVGQVWWLSGDLHLRSATHYEWSGVQQQLPGLWVANLAVTGKRVVGGLDVVLRARNLFNHRYVYPASDEVPSPNVPAPGRVIELGISVSY